MRSGFAFAAAAVASASMRARRRVRSTLFDLVRPGVGRVERVPAVVDGDDDHVGGRAAGDERRAAERDRAGQLAGHEPGQQLARRRTAVGVQQRGDDRGRDVRAGRARAPELLDDDGLLDEAGAAPAVRLVDVETDPARLGQRLPEGGAASVSASNAARTTAGAMWSSTKRRTARRRCSCSSVIPIGIRR